MLRVIEVAAACSGHLDTIRGLFKPGVKVTLIVRTPDKPERDFTLSDDDMCEAIAVLERRMEEP